LPSTYWDDPRGQGEKDKYGMIKAAGIILVKINNSTLAPQLHDCSIGSNQSSVDQTGVVVRSK
jgi:hypothetical protein